MLPVAILAGGLGTRLGAVTEAQPKILVDIDGRPFAEHQLDWLRAQQVERVVYCLGHLGEQVVDALGDGRRWNMHFDFVMDGPVLLGTGGALRQALPVLGEQFFVLYGDSLLTCDLAEILGAHEAGGRACLMTVYANNHQWDRSNVAFLDGEIVEYSKSRQSSRMRHIDYGLGIISAQALAGYPADRSLDLATVYEDQLRIGQLTGCEVATRFYEIGSPAGLDETRAFVKEQTSRQ